MPPLNECADPVPIDQVPIARGHRPLIGHALRLRQGPLAFFQQLRGEGDLVRVDLGPLRFYAVNSPELINQMLLKSARSFQKGAIFDKARPILGNGLIASSGDYHLRQRRLMQPAFHRDRIAYYADVMGEFASAKADSWTPGQQVEMLDELRGVSLEIVAKTLVSATTGTDIAAEICTTVPVLLDGISWRTLSPFAFLERIPTARNRRFNDAVARTRSILLYAIERYRDSDADHGDLLSMLLTARDQSTGEGMTDDQVYDEFITLMLTGLETVANAMAWFLYELGRNPDVAQRVYAEIDEVLDGHPARIEDLPKLEYTQRVIKETARLYSLPMLMRRTITTVSLGRYQLPPNTEVLFCPYALHRDPVLYPDPLRFDPDRWLPGLSQARPKHHFIPFGAGSRQCIGEGFAWTEMPIVLGTLLSRWRPRPVPGHSVRPIMATTVHPDKLPMVIEAR